MIDDLDEAMKGLGTPPVITAATPVEPPKEKGKRKGKAAVSAEAIAKVMPEGPATGTGADLGLFSPDELAEIQEEAAAEELAEQRKEARKRILAAERLKVRQKVDPHEELRTITLDLAGHSDRIVLDGVIYLHGRTYNVPKRVYDAILDCAARGWEHENEVGGANRDAYRKPRETIVSPMGTMNAPIGQLNTSNLMRV